MPSPAPITSAVARILIDAGCSLEWEPPPARQIRSGRSKRLIDLRRDGARIGLIAVRPGQVTSSSGFEGARPGPVRGRARRAGPTVDIMRW